MLLHKQCLLDSVSKINYYIIFDIYTDFKCNLNLELMQRYFCALTVKHNSINWNKEGSNIVRHSKCILCNLLWKHVGWDSSVGIGTLYGLDGPGIEPRWGRDFLHLPQTGPPSLLYNGYRVFLPGVKRPGRGIDQPHQSSAEVKERVELYLYSPFGGLCGLF